MTTLAEGTGLTVPSESGNRAFEAARPARLDLHSRAVETMGARIVSGELAPGTTFLLRDLAAELGTSLSVAREAARVLEALGLLAAKRRLGVTVLPRVSWQMLDPRIVRWHRGTRTHSVVTSSLATMLLGVAPDAARLAAGNATAPELTQIGSLALSLLADAGLDPGAPAGHEPAPALTMAHLVMAVVRGARNPHYTALADMVDAAWLPTGGTHQQDVVALAVALTQRDGCAAQSAMALLTSGHD